MIPAVIRRSARAGSGSGFRRRLRRPGRLNGLARPLTAAGRDWARAVPGVVLAVEPGE